MPRLFAALPIPESLTDRLALMRGGIENARWIEPRDYHVTLTFLGEVSETIANDFADTLDRIDCASVPVELLGFSSFGGERPRTLQLDVRPTAELLALHHAVEAAARSVGIETENRKYYPHITLARFRAGQGAGLGPWISRQLPPAGADFMAQEFCLYTSRPGGGGGPYEAVARFALRTGEGAG